MSFKAALCTTISVRAAIRSVNVFSEDWMLLIYFSRGSALIRDRITKKGASLWPLGFAGYASMPFSSSHLSGPCWGCSSQHRLSPPIYLCLLHKILWNSPVYHKPAARAHLERPNVGTLESPYCHLCAERPACQCDRRDRGQGSGLLVPTASHLIHHSFHDL